VADLVTDETDINEAGYLMLEGKRNETEAAERAGGDRRRPADRRGRDAGAGLQPGRDVPGAVQLLARERVRLCDDAEELRAADPHRAVGGGGLRLRRDQPDRKSVV